MASSDSMRAEELEREIAADRRRIEERMDAIQAKMSPGQLLDEALSYAKASGGGEYVANLGSAMKTNPVPVALMGISMAWLMANPGARAGSHSSDADEPEHPLATVRGSVRRAGPVQVDGAYRYSHFADESGSRFKALTDQTGRRAGHFIDETGKTYRGFADATGRQMHDIRDETGKLFDEASGWASRTWGRMTSSASHATDSMKDGARSVGSGAMAAGDSLRNHATNLNESIVKHFQDQPLIGGALAFALGAAIGAALPNTRHEDEAMGETAEDIREQLSNTASDAMHKAENVASDVYNKAATVASDVHDVAKERIAQEARQYQQADGADRGDPLPR